VPLKTVATSRGVQCQGRIHVGIPEFVLLPNSMDYLNREA
jgi:hypothetical protein